MNARMRETNTISIRRSIFRTTVEAARQEASVNRNGTAWQELASNTPNARTTEKNAAFS